ncbi:hypothetical protein ACFPN2_09970 [Steroidobacter flavus]|uniref:RES domain-containing protein n=1 Tax=Steroidobacter flavus TaxID=1842136 RepID=A0ABV8SQZ7_9GAMM
MFRASSLPQLATPWEDEYVGLRYRGAAQLRDGSTLPCVVFQSRERTVEFISRRLREETDPLTYQILVQSYLTASGVSELDVTGALSSRFAWPTELLQEIRGETMMGYTAFVAEMKDAQAFNYLVESARFEFIELPDGYEWADIKTIKSGMVYSSTRGMEAFTPERRKDTRFLGAKHYFTCYVTNLS